MIFQVITLVWEPISGSTHARTNDEWRRIVTTAVDNCTTFSEILYDKEAVVVINRGLDSVTLVLQDDANLRNTAYYWK